MNVLQAYDSGREVNELATRASTCVPIAIDSQPDLATRVSHGRAR